MQFDRLGRREFVTLLGGAVAAWPLAARAQQATEQLRRIAVLMNEKRDDPEAQARVTALLQGLQQHGWIEGRNLSIEYRWGGGDPSRMRAHAAELVALSPEVIVATGGFGIGPLQEATRTIPIVFPTGTDPVGAGYVASLARPGGNITGFTLYEYAIGTKWLELLTQMAAGMARVAILRDPAVPSGIGQFGAIQGAAASFGLEATPIDIRRAEEIERALTEFARSAKGGLIVTASAMATVHRHSIIALAARHRLPAIYPLRYYAADGGLISYGPDLLDQYRRAAGYVDRILKGEKPADLPVQAPTKYELVINLITAKALGLEMPPMLLARADEVIE